MIYPTASGRGNKTTIPDNKTTKTTIINTFGGNANS